MKSSSDKPFRLKMDNGPLGMKSKDEGFRWYRIVDPSITNRVGRLIQRTYEFYHPVRHIHRGRV